MPNRLANENSPYLLQHADNPVDWYPWGEEALEKARREDKPIFLSIGYAACHWCHVMAQESFENPETAAIMNEHFVNIKVDREERPDLDAIYMDAVVAMTGQGGWPMSVFLTPEGKPFFGGTYFPSIWRYRRPSFQQVLLSVARAWGEERDRLEEIGHRVQSSISGHLPLGSDRGELRLSTLQEAVQRLADMYDWIYGGWGPAPKFPQPMAIEFLLRQATRGNDQALEIALHALRAMSQGGMYDLLGGGFHRYSTDEQWLVPHFEKMLYDNALLLQVYLHAYLITGEEEFSQVVQHTLEFIQREMTHPLGGFFSSLGADTGDEEGAFYLWTKEEVLQALKDPSLTNLAIAAYGLDGENNFEGKHTLRSRLEFVQLAKQFGLETKEAFNRLEEIQGRLLSYRDRRQRPEVDDKVILAWNAILDWFLFECGGLYGVLGAGNMAMRNIHFILNSMQPNGHLLRIWRQGHAHQNAFLEDYAALILALLTGYQHNYQTGWFNIARELTEKMIELFFDPQAGFFDTPADCLPLLTRPQTLQDNATPSGSSLATMALLQMSAYTGNSTWRDMAERLLSRVQEIALRYPTAFAYWLCALDFALGPSQQIAILGDPKDEATQKLLGTVRRRYRPRSILAFSPYPPPSDSPLLLHDRPLVNGKPTAYVCQDLVCQQPVTSPGELRKKLL